MRVRFSLFTKVILFFFLNLAVIGTVFYLVFNIDFHLGPGSPIGNINGPIVTLAHQMSFEMRDMDKPERDAALKRYSEQTNVDLWIFSDHKDELAGDPLNLPDEILREFPGPPDRQGPPRPMFQGPMGPGGPPPGGPRGRPGGPGGPGGP